MVSVAIARRMDELELTRAYAEIEAKKTLNNVNYGDIDTKGKIIVIVAGVLFTIAALISFAG